MTRKNKRLVLGTLRRIALAGMVLLTMAGILLLAIPEGSTLLGLAALDVAFGFGICHALLGNKRTCVHLFDEDI